MIKTPKTIINMIMTKMNHGLDAKTITGHLNSSKYAIKHNLNYKHRSVATIMGNIRRGWHSKGEKHEKN